MASKKKGRKPRDRRAEEIRRLKRKLLKQTEATTEGLKKIQEQAEAIGRLDEEQDLAEKERDRIIGALARLLGKCAATGDLELLNQQDFGEEGLEELNNDMSDLIVGEMGRAYTLEKIGRL